MSQRTLQRIYAEKRPEYAVEARGILDDLRAHFGLSGLRALRVLQRYDVEGVDEATFAAARDLIFAEAPVDLSYRELPEPPDVDFVLAVEALPGQYDQRADFAAQCLQVVSRGERPLVRTARVYLFSGAPGEAERARIRAYLINPVECREASLERPAGLARRAAAAPPVARLEDFAGLDEEGLCALHRALGLAMSRADLRFVQEHFRGLGRAPSMTEIRVIDTYWSDHCRHTTFNTVLEALRLGAAPDAASEPLRARLARSLERYLREREQFYGARLGEKPPCLMDMATLGAKLLRRDGYAEDLDLSEEINACSIKLEVPVDGFPQAMLLMFKNETHNHPTEIEPFGGAATCLGGAIRDPLSGRAYVYQSMRVSGAADPRASYAETLPGKLPQRKITTGAAAGFSAYGNQIGLATGQVTEIYHPGYLAKRMEIGAVIAAAPADQVVRERPEPGDVVVLLGGRTGRDGIGGATGSSKIHDEKSVQSSGSEVQKGNPPTERALQRLFRRPEIARLIRRCNDFGAGGVCVAVGELAEGLEIDLDEVPVKYEGLDGTELAISESQERMAVVLRPEVVRRFLAAADEENLEARVLATVSAEPAMRMKWRGETIVDLQRSFIDTNGAPQRAEAEIRIPALGESYFKPYRPELPFAARLKAALSDLNETAQKGLVERFDNSIGAGTVLHPFAGLHQLTPEEGMAAKLPLLRGECDWASLMSFGFDPELSSWSPYHGAYFAVAQALAKLTAMGASPRKARLSLQEYFPRTDSPEKWGLPAAALLGALQAQLDFKVPAIGGKDSMSGNFKDIEVPPTLVAFAVGTRPTRQIHSALLREPGRALMYFPLPLEEGDFLDPDRFQRQMNLCHKLQKLGHVEAISTVKRTGAAAAVVKQCFGQHLGFSFNPLLAVDTLFTPQPGALIVEVVPDSAYPETLHALKDAGALLLGQVSSAALISFGDEVLSLDEARAAWFSGLDGVFPRLSKEGGAEAPPRPETLSCAGAGAARAPAQLRAARPRVFIPVFPGTNCEDDTARAFRRAGAEVDVCVFRNKTTPELAESIEEMGRRIDRAQMLMIPGGFSAGDEPEGSAKFIAAVFRSPRLSEAVSALLERRGGLILGICNGFQALIKLGLLPHGRITPLSAEDATLTFNTIGRHVARYVRTRVASARSPWLALNEVGDIHSIAISHGEGRFVAPEAQLRALAERGQVATQYVDLSGRATMAEPYNPNGSLWAVEGLCSPDGRILGKMGHSERIGRDVAKNIPGEKDQRLFEAGVRYFL